MELFRPQAPSCQSPSMCQCVGIVSTKERVMAVVANLRRSWIQCHLPRQRIWQCPLSDSKHGHLWLQNYWSRTIGSANLGAKAIESCIDLIFTLDRSKHRIHPRLLCQFLCIVHQDPTHDCKTQCTVVSAPVSAPVCPGSAPRLPRSAPRLPRVCPVSARSARVCPVSAPCLHRSAPCLPRYCPLGYRFLWLGSTDDRHLDESPSLSPAVVRGYSFFPSAARTHWRKCLDHGLVPYWGRVCRIDPLVF